MRSGTRDFLLAAYHARFNGTMAQRHAEVRHLVDVAAWLHLQRASASIVIAGDFNLVPRAIARDVPGHHETPASAGSGTTVNGGGRVSRNIYDHVLLWSPDSSTNATEILSQFTTAAGGTTYFRTVSDHLPVRWDATF